MIIGIGTDIVDIRRMSVDFKFLDRFAQHILSKMEYNKYTDSTDKRGFLAKRIAAKEAFIKATGTASPLAQIEIDHDPNGKPFIRCTYYSMPRTHLTISDDGHYVVAFVVVED